MILIIIIQDNQLKLELLKLSKIKEFKVPPIQQIPQLSVLQINIIKHKAWHQEMLVLMECLIKVMLMIII